MGERELICIICPKGCRLKAETGENGEVLNVTGNGCRRGSEYAKDECEHPMRTVTSTMRCSDGAVISVKTDSAIPKDKIGECMKIINRGSDGKQKLKCFNISYREESQAYPCAFNLVFMFSLRFRVLFRA